MIAPVLAVAGGAALLGVVGLELFHTLVHPSGSGRLTNLVLTGVWRVCTVRGPWASTRLRLAGPLAVLTVVLTWIAVSLVGWALIFSSALPGGFVYSSGLDPTTRSMLVDSVYLAAVAMSTLGFGDIVPQADWLRLVVPAAAFDGFALLTAAVTWILQLYPALARRRTLATRLHHLLDAWRAMPEPDPGSEPSESTLMTFAADLAAVRVDFIQHPEAFYFHDGDHDLPEGLLSLTAVLDEADASTANELGRRTLTAAVADLAQVLQQHWGYAGAPEEVLLHHAQQHRYRQPASRRRLGCRDLSARLRPDAVNIARPGRADFGIAGSTRHTRHPSIAAGHAPVAGSRDSTRGC
ncbi:potassium channel family protein [Amnibacterium endophyticum]|uniref:Potassium channel family protein n=1 Tax=Amnibacterium endophyticum TaxID=2109337 RepID=A0ABW4LGT7_9MICO